MYVCAYMYYIYIYTYGTFFCLWLRNLPYKDLGCRVGPCERLEGKPCYSLLGAPSYFQLPWPEESLAVECQDISIYIYVDIYIYI